MLLSSSPFAPRRIRRLEEVEEEENHGRKPVSETHSPRHPSPMMPPSQELLALLARTYGPEAALAMVQRLHQRQQQQHQEQERPLSLVKAERSMHLLPRLAQDESPAASAAGGAAKPAALGVTLMKREDDSSDKTGFARRSRSVPAFLACHVCGDRAPNHIHYGGIACFSCRAFFRRSVPKHASYFCMADGSCQITPATRKNCQFCRYQNCLRAGMKSSWVLSDKEKLERTAKKMENRARRIQQAVKSKQQEQQEQQQQQVQSYQHLLFPHPYHVAQHMQLQPTRSASTGSSSAQSSSSPSPPLPTSTQSAALDFRPRPAAPSPPALESTTPNIVEEVEVETESPLPPTTPPSTAAHEESLLTAAEEAQVDAWLEAQESTRHTVLMPNAIMSELIRMTTTGAIMSQDNIVELFKLGYSRVAAFSKTVEEFAELKAETRKALLSKNLDVMSNLRLCSCLNPDGSGDLLAQLRQAGRATNIEYRLGGRAVQLEQVFVEPWAKDEAHRRFFCSVMRRLARHCHDERTALLAQMVALFHSYGVDIEDAGERARVEAAQVRMATMLKKHLQAKLDRSDGVVAVSNLILWLQDLRRLAEILTGEATMQEERS